MVSIDVSVVALRVTVGPVEVPVEPLVDEIPEAKLPVEKPPTVGCPAVELPRWYELLRIILPDAEVTTV